MKKIKPLRIAEYFFKFLIGLTITGILFFLFIFIHSEISPKRYEQVTLGKNNSGITYNANIPPAPKTYKEFKSYDSKDSYLIKLDTGNKIIYFAKAIFYWVMCLLILKQLLNFIYSIKNYATFHGNNSMYFKKMARYFGIMLIFSILFFKKGTIMVFPDMVYENRTTNFNLTSFISLFGYFIVAIVISRVFKEGERLKQENDLTI
jgi:hypothetical protein